jgi:hypothetical protein
MIVLSLNRFSSGNSLRGCAETYGIHKSTASIIVREFCAAIEKHLKPIVIEKQYKATLNRIAAEFEELRGLPYVIGAVDGSHIPIIAPPIDPTSYYCRKGFYSAPTSFPFFFFSKNLGLQKIYLVSLRSSKIMVLSHRALQSSSPRHGPSNSLSSILHLLPRPSRSFSEVFLKLRLLSSLVLLEL